MNQSSNETSSQAFPIKLTKQHGKVTATAPTIKNVAPVTAATTQEAIHGLQRAVDAAIFSGKIAR